MYNALIFTILSIISCILGLKESKKVEISKDSKIDMFELFIPKIIQHETIYYCLSNLIISAIIYYFYFLKFEFNYSNTIEMIKFIVIFQSCFMLSVIDLKSFKIPNKYTFPLIIIMTLFSLLSIGTFLNSLFGLLAGFFAIFLLQIINPNGIGGGDAKLCALLGILLGFPNIIYGILGGFVLGGLFALILLKMKLISRKDYIPYGVYFFIASIITYFIF